MKELLKNHSPKTIAAACGAATFFFGFGAGALFNLYLIYINSPTISGLRTSLTFKSAIYGDGIVLPVINAIATLFLLRNIRYITRKTLALALLWGVLITAYFHIRQALGGLVNWAMPSPWHWNLLGLYHGVYMYSVASFLTLFYFTTFKVINKEKRVPVQFTIITLGMIIFFALLEYDYR